jgi:hypothetical protein
MKKTVTPALILILVLCAFARADEGGGGKQEEQGDAVDQILLWMPISFGESIADLKRSLMELSDYKTAPDMRAPTPDPGGAKSDFPTRSFEFGPPEDGDSAWFKIKGMRVHGSLKFLPEYAPLSGRKFYKPGEYFDPMFGTVPSLRFDLQEIPYLYREFQTGVFLTIEF